MSLKTFRAETMAEALAQVKRDLGRKAVILNTRTVKTGGWLGLGAKNIVEITAGDEINVLPPRLRQDSIGSSSSGLTPLAKGGAVQSSSKLAIESSDTPAVHRELQDIKALIHGLVKQNNKEELHHLAPELRQAYMQLIQNQVAEELAGDLIRQLRTKSKRNKLLTTEQIREFLIQQISQLLPPVCPIELSEEGGCKVIALIGPTGVGKTTTIAKLAAHFRLKMNKKVGLITIDTYRIAAVDQLRTYAKIIDIPLQVALTPAELRQAVEEFKSCDIVLIDSAGRSQADMLRLGELKQFLDAARPHETHLVLSCNVSLPVLADAAEKFSKLNINRVIFTKLDEAVGMGTLLSVTQKLNAQLSYITTGQDVPNHIEAVDSRRLARLVIDGFSPQN